MNNPFVSFKYHFDSGTGPWEGDRYVREVKMEIFSQDEYGDPLNLIGKVAFKVIYIDQAINAGYDLLEIFDSNEYTFRHAQEFFDFETDEIKEEIQKFYNYNIISANICLLEMIEILPESRGYQIAAKATKDIIFHFASGCALFVIQAYPLQFEPKDREQNDWQKKLRLKEFPSLEKTAFKQLRTYYKSFGFDEIKGYKELLFFNPQIKNDRLDAINLEE